LFVRERDKISLDILKYVQREKNFYSLFDSSSESSDIDLSPSVSSDLSSSKISIDESQSSRGDIEESTSSSSSDENNFEEEEYVPLHKALNSSKLSITCLLCHRKGETLHNPFLGPRDHQVPNVFVHEDCCFYSPLAKGETIGSMLNRVKRVRIKCAECGKVHASVGCQISDCQNSYHLPCAKKCGGEYVPDQGFYCEYHIMMPKVYKKSAVCWPSIYCNKKGISFITKCNWSGVSRVWTAIQKEQKKHKTWEEVLPENARWFHRHLGFYVKVKVK